MRRRWGVLVVVRKPGGVVREREVVVCGPSVGLILCMSRDVARTVGGLWHGGGRRDVEALYLEFV